MFLSAPPDDALVDVAFAAPLVAALVVGTACPVPARKPKLFLSKNFKFRFRTHAMSHHQKMRGATGWCWSRRCCDARACEWVIALDYSHPAAPRRQLDYVTKEMSPIASHPTPAGMFKSGKYVRNCLNS